MGFYSDWIARNPGKGGLLANAEFVLKKLDELPTSMPPTAHTHTKSEITDFPASMPPTEHNHDDRYYTETELSTQLPNTAASLPANANLNSYTTPGFYYTPANATAQTMTNTPWGTGTSTSAVSFSLMVVKHAGVTQILRTYNVSGYEYQRQYYDGTWGDWVRMARTSDAPATHTHTKSQITDFPVRFKLNYTGEDVSSAVIFSLFSSLPVYNISSYIESSQWVTCNGMIEKVSGNSTAVSGDYGKYIDEMNICAITKANFSSFGSNADCLLINGYKLNRSAGDQIFWFSLYPNDTANYDIIISMDCFL